MAHNPTRVDLLVTHAIGIPFTSEGSLTKRLFNQVNTTSGKVELADVNAEGIVGVLYDDVAGADQEAIEITEGKATVVLDTTLDEQDLVKVGSGGRATLWKGSQTTIQATITGEATAFTQPAAASVMTVAQAVDVEADRGRGITIVGSDGAGAGIMETILLDGTDSSTPVDGLVSFTHICGVYTEDGAVLGAQDVTVTDDDPVLLVTLAGASSEIGADIPDGTQEAYCNILDLEGPNADATFVTIVGYKNATPTTLTAERLTFDGSSPSVASTATGYRYVERICLGEFTDADTGEVMTDSDYDPSERIQGRCITPGTYSTDGAIQLM